MLSDIELYAWIGEDERGTGAIGIKQALVPAGMIPLVAIRRDKIDGLKATLQRQADRYGKRIYLVRFAYAEIIDATEERNGKGTTDTAAS